MSISRRALLVHAAVAPYLVLTFALTFAAQTAAAAESGSDESPSSKILRFPNDHSIGTIKFHVHGKKLSPHPARGTIRVPRQATVSLSINYESTRDLSPLGSLAPNSLRTLTMSKLEIKDEQLKYIAHLTGLRMLNLQETDITNDGLDFLKNLKALDNLVLRSTLITGAGLVKLKPLSNLERLNISSNRLEDGGLDALVGLKKLRRLHCVRSGISDKSLKPISSMTQIHELEIGYNNAITDSGMDCLSSLTNLDRLNIARTSITARSVKVLAKMHSLKRVIYDKSQFSDRDISTLKRALPNCEFVDVVQSVHFDMEIFAPLH